MAGRRRQINETIYINRKGHFPNKKWLKRLVMIGAQERLKELLPDMGPAQEYV